MEREVAAEPAVWEKRWHEEDRACAHNIRRDFAIGVVLVVAGITLFIVRLRLPGRRRDLHVVNEGKRADGTLALR
jgi:hypothetical protein